MNTLPRIIPLQTLTPTEIQREGERLDALTGPVRKLVLTSDTADTLWKIATMFSLTEKQHWGVARFLMESVFGGVPTAQATSSLSRIAGVDSNTALQIVKELENGLLAPLGLTLSGLAAPSAEPALVINENGNEGLRYASADDLLGEIADLTSEQRDAFLTDAKRDNRIVVLQVLSQLKMGASSGGLPLSFRQLAASEAGAFTAQEWADLARTDPDALAEPEILHHIAGTPLGAMLQERNPTQAHDIVLQFSGLDDDARNIAVDPNSAAAIQELVSSGMVPQTHTAAIGRVVFFVLTGQSAPQDVAVLLRKVGLSAEAAEVASRTVSVLTASVTPSAPEIPTPATARTPGLNVPNVAGRTILDLRKQAS